MNSDIRLSIGFKNHRKRKRLRRILGDRADSYLIDLWLTVAIDRPGGILTGWSAEDVADACSWEGDPLALVDAFVKSGWIEYDEDGVMLVHDWPEHQGWACGAKSRAEQARKAAETRWSKGTGKKNGSSDPIDKSGDPEKKHADSMLSACGEHCSSIAGAYAPFLSLPIPSNKKTYSSKNTSNAESKTPLINPAELIGDDGLKKDSYPKPFLDFWTAYPRKVGKGAALRAYQKIKAPRPGLNQILASIKTHGKTEQWKSKTLIPHPSTFLNERRWEDEFTPEDFEPSPNGSFRKPDQIGREYAEL